MDNNIGHEEKNVIKKKEIRLFRFLNLTCN